MQLPNQRGGGYRQQQQGASPMAIRTKKTPARYRHLHPPGHGPGVAAGVVVRPDSLRGGAAAGPYLALVVVAGLGRGAHPALRDHMVLYGQRALTTCCSVALYANLSEI